jgi:hypothetical protein
MTQLWFSIVWLLNLNKNESMVIIFGSAVQLNDLIHFCSSYLSFMAKHIDEHLLPG